MIQGDASREFIVGKFQSKLELAALVESLHLRHNTAIARIQMMNRQGHAKGIFHFGPRRHKVAVREPQNRTHVTQANGFARRRQRKDINVACGVAREIGRLRTSVFVVAKGLENTRVDCICCGRTCIRRRCCCITRDTGSLRCRRRSWCRRQSSNRSRSTLRRSARRGSRSKVGRWHRCRLTRHLGGYRSSLSVQKGGKTSSRDDLLTRPCSTFLAPHFSSASQTAGIINERVDAVM
jgi:hypothetical protein